MAKRGRKGKAQRQPEPPVAAGSEPPAQPEVAHAPAQTTVAHESPQGRSRALATALIAAFLLFQIAMPLRYYLGGRGYDERFSWRMFSSVRMQNCNVQVVEAWDGGDERTLPLDKELQIAWIGMLERYRVQVVEKLLHRRCAVQGVREVRYARSCKDTDGSALPELHAELDCARKLLETEERAP